MRISARLCRIAAEIVEHTIDPDDSDLDENHYFSIGHGDDIYGEEDDQFYVWIYDAGKVVTKGPFTKDDVVSHNLYFPHFKDSTGYKGRYDDAKKIITLVKPTIRDVPQQLITKLEKTFPGAKKIYVYF